MKKCTKCGEEKPLDEFPYRKSRDYYETHCKSCMAAKQRRNVDPEYNRAKSRRWHRENPKKSRDKCSRSEHKRRATLANVASDNWTRSEVFSGSCFYCGIEVDIQNFHADHFVPLAKGGSNTRDNIVCSCADCNLRKNDKLPYDFIRERINDA